MGYDPETGIYTQDVITPGMGTSKQKKVKPRPGLAKNKWWEYTPEGNARDYVKRIYNTKLGRETPDPSGWAYWTNELELGYYATEEDFFTAMKGGKEIIDGVEWGTDWKPTVLEIETHPDKIIGDKTYIWDDELKQYKEKIVEGEPNLTREAINDLLSGGLTPEQIATQKSLFETDWGKQKELALETVRNLYASRGAGVSSGLGAQVGTTLKDYELVRQAGILDIEMRALDIQFRNKIAGAELSLKADEFAVQVYDLLNTTEQESWDRTFREKVVEMGWETDLAKIEAAAEAADMSLVEYMLYGAAIGSGAGIPGMILGAFLGLGAGYFSDTS